jgi:hypothetical protein
MISPGGWDKYKMHVRNRWIVKNCHSLLAVWDGSRGGTGNCVNTAYELGRKVLRLQLPADIPPPPFKKHLQFQEGGGKWSHVAVKKEVAITDAQISLASLFNNPPAPAPKPPQWVKVTATIKKNAMPAVPSQKREEEPEEQKPYQRFVDLSD